MRIQVIGGLAFLGLFTAASATPLIVPTFAFKTGNCGENVTVDAFTIDWGSPSLGTPGCIVANPSTNVSYVGAGNTPMNLLAGATGTINDLPGGPTTDFISFTAHPDLHFNLESIGPGSSNTTCAGLGVGFSCSVDLSALYGFPFTSPFLLTRTVTGTNVSLSVFGKAYDADGGLGSEWIGEFSVPITGQTPAQIEATIKAGNSVTSPHGGDFLLTAIPEPSTYAMLGFALGALGLYRRRSVRG